LLFLSRQTVSRVPPILKIDLIDLQRDINLTQSFMSNDFEDISAYWPKEKRPLFRPFGLRMTAISGSRYMCEHFPRCKQGDEKPSTVFKLSTSQRAIWL
jgi:hypothetical protein